MPASTRERDAYRDALDHDAATSRLERKIMSPSRSTTPPSTTSSAVAPPAVYPEDSGQVREEYDYAAASTPGRRRGVRPRDRRGAEREAPPRRCRLVGAPFVYDPPTGQLPRRRSRLSPAKAADDGERSEWAGDMTDASCDTDTLEIDSDEDEW